MYIVIIDVLWVYNISFYFILSFRIVEMDVHKWWIQLIAIKSFQTNGGISELLQLTV
jgi:hypothetical protein